jgi:hypothetical protein
VWPAPVLALYKSFSNTASRQLGLLREVVEAMAAEDSRCDAAVLALIADDDRLFLACSDKLPGQATVGLNGAPPPRQADLRA